MRSNAGGPDTNILFHRGMKITHDGYLPDVIEATLKHIDTGAKRADKTLDDLDIWAFAKV